MHESTALAYSSSGVIPVSVSISTGDQSVESLGIRPRAAREFVWLCPSTRPGCTSAPPRSRTRAGRGGLRSADLAVRPDRDDPPARDRDRTVDQDPALGVERQDSAVAKQQID